MRVTSSFPWNQTWILYLKIDKSLLTDLLAIVHLGGYGSTSFAREIFYSLGVYLHVGLLLFARTICITLTSQTV